MTQKRIDRDAIRQAEAKLTRVLAVYPELQEDNPERQQALEEWLTTLDQEDPAHG